MLGLTFCVRLNAYPLFSLGSLQFQTRRTRGQTAIRNLKQFRAIASLIVILLQVVDHMILQDPSTLFYHAGVLLAEFGVVEYRARTIPQSFQNQPRRNESRVECTANGIALDYVRHTSYLILLKPTSARRTAPGSTRSPSILMLTRIPAVVLIIQLHTGPTSRLITFLHAIDFSCLCGVLNPAHEAPLNNYAKEARVSLFSCLIIIPPAQCFLGPFTNYATARSTALRMRT